MKTTHSLRELVCFHLEGGTYAVDISEVREIVRQQRMTRVPKAPGHVLGVTNLRGHVIPVVDLRRRLGMKPQDQNAGSRILVMETGGEPVGYLVDEVAGIVRLPQEVIEPAGSLGALKGSEMVSGVARHGDQLICVLDLAQSRTEEEVLEPVVLPSAPKPAAPAPNRTRLAKAA